MSSANLADDVADDASDFACSGGFWPGKDPELRIETRTFRDDSGVRKGGKRRGFLGDSSGGFRGLLGERFTPGSG